ncbi:MAG TPA: hypothetical protein VMR66_08080 [Gemmatimonadota bacterium]|nr:hypothetical protein [Gemmatimonadota bacterium]
MPTLEAVLLRARDAAGAGRWALARRLFRKAAVATSPLPRDRARAADAHRWCSIAGLRLGDWESSVEDVDRSLSMSIALADVRREAKSLNVAGAVQFEQGDWGAALHFYDRARVVARPLKDQMLLAGIDNNEGALWAARGVTARARRLYASALAGFRAGSETVSAARVMNNLGLLMAEEGAWRQALDWYQQAAADAREARDADLLLTVLTNLARTSAECSRASHARSAADEALALAEAMEGKPAEADLFCALAAVARAEQRPAEADRWIAAALEAADGGRNPLSEADAWEQRARVRLQEGRIEEARDALDRARARYDALGAKSALVRLSGLGSTLAMEQV